MAPKSQRPSNEEIRRSPATILLIASAALLIIALFFLYPTFISGAKQKAYIKIPHDATIEMLRDSLVKYEGEDYASHVIRLIKIRRTDMSRRAGAYCIQENETPFSAMRRLTSGGQTPIRLTIPPTRNIRNLAEKLATKVAACPDSLYKAMTDSAMLASHGLTPADAKALYMEDSYDVYWTDSPKQIVDKIAGFYDARWNENRVNLAKELGLSPREVMIICSIVDEETNAISEKGRVGRVYINRLESGMKLQSDPTVRFAIGDFTIRRVKGEHLKVDSPYNTYKYEGLPPGPIRTTSVQTVDAILESRPTFEIYMCAREDFSGRHNFATTYEEHLENAKRYQKALDERGIH